MEGNHVAKIVRTITLILGFTLVMGCGRGPEDLQRVLVVAIEGADLEFIEPMLDRGELPNLARLIGEGTHGTLFSTVPPITPASWTALTTGKGPGRTGIYQWAVLAPGTYRGNPVTGASIASEKRVWDLVSEAGGRVIVVNVPFTFPPIKVNGVLISGIPADENGVFAYPPDLAEQLRQKGYVPHFKGPRPLDEYLAAMDERARMVSRYMRKLDWNLCVVSLKGLDEACHFYIEDPEAIDSVYAQADLALGQLIETAGPETTVMVLSDHGYFPGPYDRYFSINRWLLDEGFLNLRGRLDDSLRVIPFTPESQHDLGLGRYQVLWPRTQAFSIADCHCNFGHIRINLRGREPTGIVESGIEYEKIVHDIKQRLLAFSDPETGEQVVGRVFTREEIYAGDRVDQLPDIFFQTTRGVLPLGITISGIFELSQVVGPLQIGRNHPYPGNYERDGMFVLHGSQIRIGKQLDAELMNIAPTLLYLMGLPIPTDFDGRVIEEAFAEEHLADNPVRLSRKNARRKEEPQFITGTDPSDRNAQEIMNALGYLR